MKKRIPSKAGSTQPWSRGFTLLEVLIAVAILSISLTILFGAQSQGLDHVTEAHFKLLAPLLADRKFVELQLAQEMQGGEGDFGDEYPGYTWRLSVEQASFPGREELEDLDPPILRAEMEVIWNQTGYRYQLVQYGRW
jgi:general secretion pathway protein I